MPPLDTRQRPLESLRLSVTDRCNLRCGYCMPEEEYSWLPKSDLLSFEEIAELVGAFCDQGVRHLRLTGGEPLLRKSLPTLIAMVRADERLEDVALTTNGLLLADQAADLARAGLDRVTVSLDTLQPERFRALTRRDGLDRVLAGLEAAEAAGLKNTKLDTVVLRGTNDDELVPLIEFARERKVEVRFIEYMDVGGATNFDMQQVVSRAEMLQRLEDHYGPITEAPKRNRAPANRFQLPDGTVFGIIASTTEPFCRSCDRSRLTADGLWFLCLYAQVGIDLRSPLRAGAGPQELAARIRGTWSERDDRGAEQRLEEREHKPFATPGELRADPHLEMHTRGG